jgi:large subunit ribosomal protein L30
MYAAIKIRGNIKVSKDIIDSMKMLNLTRTNHMVLVPEKKNLKKMIVKARSYLTYGEVNAETLAKALKKRGRLPGNKKISNEFLKKHKLNDFKQLATELISEKTTLKKLGIKPVLRLKAPRKGFERGGIKKEFSQGGALGYRAEAINELIRKMI